MEFAGKRYYDINRLLLISIGLWPYDMPSRVKAMFCYSVYAVFFIFQFTPLLTRNCNFEYVVKQLSYSLPGVAYISLYSIFYFNTDMIRRLLEQIKRDWNTMERNSEIKILKKYACYSNLISLMLFDGICVTFLVLCVLSLMCIVTIEFAPMMLDFVAPLNESRPRRLILEFELFIDADQYFLVYLIQEIVVMTIIAFTLIATGPMLLAFLTHGCATYKIASNLLENLMTEEMNKISVFQRVRMMHRNLSRAVHIHKTSMLLVFIRFTSQNIYFRDALVENGHALGDYDLGYFYCSRFCKNFLVVVNKWIAVTMLAVVFSLSCNLLRVFIALTVTKDLLEIFLCSCVAVGHFVAMFLGNMLGQLVIDHSSDIFHAAYRTMWYIGPLSIQKSLLFTMQRSVKADTLLIGGLFVASLEGFSTLMTTSISYFTVFCNLN